jgi:hypothetical protein
MRLSFAIAIEIYLLNLPCWNGSAIVRVANWLVLNRCLVSTGERGYSGGSLLVYFGALRIHLQSRDFVDLFQDFATQHLPTESTMGNLRKPKTPKPLFKHREYANECKGTQTR